MNEDEKNNELVIPDDELLEANEETEQIETDASEGIEGSEQNGQEEQVEHEKQEEQKTYTHEELEYIIGTRLSREKAKTERERAKEMAKYDRLESMMKTALNANDIDDVIAKAQEFYKEQGISIPEGKSSALSERDEIVLAQSDAKDIIAIGKEEMEAEVNRIASIPQEERSLRDKTVFNEICEKLVSMKDEESLKMKGYDTKILESKDFRSFRGQFNLNTPITQVYEMYKAVKGNKPIQPKSPGSAKTSSTNNEIKEYYTPEEARNFTDKDLDNPKLMAVLERSMQQWEKR